jgi:protoporphyrinogen/coproporphyrinogen III oxidase
MRPVCVIVGGGISGLAAAYELHTRRVPFLLLESSRRFGGVIHTEHAGEFVIDAGPDAILTQKPGAVALCRELGVELAPVNTPGTFVARGGALRRLPEAGAFGIPADWRGMAHTQAFSPLGKIRMAAEYFIPPRGPAAASDDESIASFVRRRFGREALATIGEPLMAGIHSGGAEHLSMRALFPRFLQLEQQYGSVLRGVHCASGTEGRATSPFACVQGGTEQLVTALRNALPSECLRAGVDVRAVERGDQWEVRLADGERLQACAVMIATPPRVAARVLREAEPLVSEACGRIRSVPIVTVAVGYDRASVAHPLAGSGFVVPSAEQASVTAMSWVTSKWRNRAPDNRVLLRGFLGGARDEAVFDRSDDAIVSGVEEDARRYLGISAKPLITRVYRWPHGGMQLDVGHLNLMDEIESRLAVARGLRMSAAGFRGVGIADCVADARTQAAKLSTEVQFS